MHYSMTRLLAYERQAEQSKIAKDLAQDAQQQEEHYG